MVEPATRPGARSEPSLGFWSAGRRHEGAAQIRVSSAMLRTVLDFSEGDLQRERGGFLLGRVRMSAVVSVEVSHFLPAAEARSRAGSLAFPHAAWARLSEELDQRGSAWHLVGWQHTHPGMGVFLSAADHFIHRHFFGELWQVALVVDPVARQFGFFQWWRDEIVSCGIEVDDHERTGPDY